MTNHRQGGESAVYRGRGQPTEPRETASRPGEGNAGRKRSVAKTVGLGIITGAADNDPFAIGTYASAGAKFGLGLLWVTPIILPMMFTVVYLSAKLGQVSGRGLFHVIRDFYPP